jgi:cell wall-associated NlpC family hydrolase
LAKVSGVKPWSALMAGIALPSSKRLKAIQARGPENPVGVNMAISSIAPVNSGTFAAAVSLSTASLPEHPLFQSWFRPCVRFVLIAGLAAAAALGTRASAAGNGDDQSAETPLLQSGLVDGLQASLGAQAIVMQGVVDRALGYIGVPYRFGGSNPQTGFDCSGLVNHVFRETLGVVLPRTSRQLAGIGVAVPREELRPGDLVFFNTRGAANSHVGIYLGDGRFVHAPRARTLVRIDRLDDIGYRGRFEGARRLDTLALLIAPVDPRL